MNRNKVFLISALVLALSLQACGSNTVVFSPPPSTVAVLPTATALPGASPQYPAKFGSDLSIDHMKFAVAGAIRPADEIVASGSIFNAQPSEYHHYIFVTLNVTCDAPAEQQCHLNLSKLKLLRSDNTLLYPKWFISGVDGILSVADFQGGTTISGNVPFIVAIGDSGLLFMYESLSGDSFYFALP